MTGGPKLLNIWNSKLPISAVRTLFSFSTFILLHAVQHWNRVLDPSINKGPWAVAEEKILVDTIQEYEKSKTRISWSALARKLPGRTDTQCRYQYIKLERSRKIPWTVHEDQYLLELAQNRNPNDRDWVEICTQLYRSLLKGKNTQYKTPPRSSLNCKERYESLPRQHRDQTEKNQHTFISKPSTQTIPNIAASFLNEKGQISCEDETAENAFDEDDSDCDAKIVINNDNDDEEDDSFNQQNRSEGEKKKYA